MKIRRAIKYFFQRRKRGWDDSELWSIDYSFFKWIHPRLVRFKTVNIGHPISLGKEEWESILDQMIEGFSIPLQKDWWWADSSTEDEKVETAMTLFHKHYRNLWW